ncbi:hypothetical protein GRAN_2516 [Granulicella sibirica]|uniref:Uncharacterized protein n=1 Tax=Granulicella sibirica TaxID=2479048 RepID=A0A4Q0T1A3_9BACT|nr:hypothetical protein GRAN_2516 [Granulicella sibirica]
MLPKAMRLHAGQGSNGERQTQGASAPAVPGASLGRSIHARHRLIASFHRFPSTREIPDRRGAPGNAAPLSASTASMITCWTLHGGCGFPGLLRGIALEYSSGKAGKFPAGYPQEKQA